MQTSQGIVRVHKITTHFFSIAAMCRVLNIHRSDFYAWLKKTISDRTQEDKCLLGHIKQFWMKSGFSYGYRNITKDIKGHGESCGKNRVHRIMKQAGICSQRGDKRHKGFLCARLAMLRKTP